MSCQICYNTSCPEPSEVNLYEATMSLAVARYVEAAVTGTSVDLPTTHYSGFAPMVFVNGVLQRETTHYTLSTVTGPPNFTRVTFTGPLAADDVVVVYVTGS